MKKVAIIGAGLSGLTMAYNIKQNCEADVIIFEKGKSYTDRIDTEGKDLLCGEGGAGTILGGKLCFPPASLGVWTRSGFNIKMFEDFQKQILEPFDLNKNPLTNILTKEIYLKNKELFLKDYTSILLNKAEMRTFIMKLINCVKEKGVIIHNNCELLDYVKNNEKYSTRCLSNGLIKEMIGFDYLIFSSGRLSSDSTSKWLNKAVVLQNPDLGIRFSMKYANSGIFKNIGKDIKIKAKFGKIGVRTFCVCSGGNKTIVDLNGMKYYDGHFEDNITDEVNIGILARSPYIFGYEGAALFCSCLKSYIGSDLSLKDFVNYSNRLINETNIFSDILDSISKFINLLKQEHIIDKNLDKYPVWLPSVDRLNPIVSTNRYFETECDNLYVIGDAIGISRGYIQSMWSAYCASENIVNKIKNQEYMKRMII